VKERKIVSTEKAPAAIGAYSQANVLGGDLIITSGQIPIDPSTGELVGFTVTSQTEQVIENLKAIIEAAGSSLNDVVKTTVYLTDIGSFSEFNEVYSRYFNGDALPSRTTVEVTELPRGSLVEIEAIAIKNS